MPVYDYNKSTDEDRLIEFFGKTLAKNYLSRESSQFAWQFQGSPYLKAPETGLLLLKNSPEIQAILGYVPLLLKFRNSCLPAAFMSHWFAHQEAQHKGAGALPFLELRSRYPNHFVLGLSSHSKRILTRMRYFIKEALPRAVWILDRERVAGYSHIKALNLTSQANVLTQSVGGALELWDLGKIEQCFFRFQENVSMCVYRDKTTLNWRYVQHPTFKYECIVADENFTGLAIVRVEKIMNSDRSVLRVLEFLPAITHGETTALLNNMMNFGRSHECDFMDFFCSNVKILELLKTEGWLCGQLLEQIKLPRLFQPMEHRDHDGIVFAMCLQNITIKEIDDLWDQSYFTKSDGDQDRPKNFS